MALDFPSSPVDGQTYTAEGQTWVWNAANGCWFINSPPYGGYLPLLNDSSDELQGTLVVRNGQDSDSGTADPVFANVSAVFYRDIVVGHEAHSVNFNSFTGLTDLTGLGVGSAWRVGKSSNDFILSFRGMYTEEFQLQSDTDEVNFPEQTIMLVDGSAGTGVPGADRLVTWSTQHQFNSALTMNGGTINCRANNEVLRVYRDTTRSLVIYKHPNNAWTGLLPFNTTTDSAVWGGTLAWDETALDWFMGASTYAEGYRLLNQNRGDQRYLQLSGGELTGNLTINSQNLYITHTQPAIISVSTGGGGQWDLLHGAGGNWNVRGDAATLYTFNKSASLAAGSSIVNRDNGDARYARQADPTTNTGSWKPYNLLQFQRIDGAAYIDTFATSGASIAVRGKPNDGTATNWATITSTAGWTAGSDRKLKTAIAPLVDGALDKLMQLIPSTYTRKDTGVADMGFVAQDVQSIVPEAVTEVETEADGTKDVERTLMMRDSTPLVALLVKAVQELTTRVMTLEEDAGYAR